MLLSLILRLCHQVGSRLKSSSPACGYRWRQQRCPVQMFNLCSAALQTHVCLCLIKVLLPPQYELLLSPSANTPLRECVCVKYFKTEQLNLKFLTLNIHLFIYFTSTTNLILYFFQFFSDISTHPTKHNKQFRKIHRSSVSVQRNVGQGRLLLVVCSLVSKEPQHF